MSFWTIFALLSPKNPKNQNVEKMEKNTWRYYHFTTCTVNDNHMMYGSWDMECDRQNFLSFWTIFWPFNPYPLPTQKFKILIKWKKHLEVSSFYKSVPKSIIICYTVPVIRRMTDVIFISHFGLFFALLSPLRAQKIKIKKKMKKTPGDIIILDMCTKNYDHMCMVPKIWCAMDGWMDRQTGRWKRWHIEVGGSLKNWNTPTLKS